MNIPEVSPTLGVKLASIAVHADEAVSSDGHDFDRVAIRAGLADPDVREYLKALDDLALLPKKRNG